MIIKRASAFKEYLEPLRLLESSLKAAGLDIEFETGCTYGKGKWIFLNRGGKTYRVVSIEGDNAAQAVKDVAAAVRL
ncbi:MAG: hypothetical protein LBP37_06820 [Spirochaetaceae bacterium]|jgi:hypothetical protein|nr:hypothetical protein [Spirochaetaceae bacterium]